jgi:outer membrane immunogenic protein
MKKSLLAGIAFAALIAAPAMAADLGVHPAPSYKAPPPPVAAVYGWTGCYVGVEGGGAWGRSHHEAVTPGSFATSTGNTRIAGDFDISGGLAGGTVGCNFQLGGAWVLGIEGDGSWVSKSGSVNDISPSFNPAYTSGTKEKWLATGRARLGMAVNPWVLLYGTGGFAGAGVEADVTPPGGPTFAETKTRWGWTAGAGVEYAFTGNLSAKLEYLYVQLQGSSYFDVIPAGCNCVSRSDVSVNDHIVRAGLNWRFGAPLAARY